MPKKPAPKKSSAGDSRKQSMDERKKVVDDSASDDSSNEEVKAPVAAKRARAASNVSNRSVASSTRGATKNADKKKRVVDDSASDSSGDDNQLRSVGSDSEDGPKDAKPAAAEDSGDADNCELFVKSLSFDTTEDGLRDHFGQFGELTKVKLIQSHGRSKGLAFIEFAKRADAQKALDESDNFALDGREISVEFSGPRKPPTPSGGGGASDTLFCGNLGFNTTEDAIYDFFGPSGKVKNVRIATGEDGRPRGFCHVEFETAEGAQAAMGLTGQMLDGRAVRLDLSNNR